MSSEKFATQEELFERIDELVERVSIWDGSDPEVINAMLDDLDVLSELWPPGQARELAKDTCNRIARLTLLFEHQLGDDLVQVQRVVTAAVNLLQDLASGGRPAEGSLQILQDVAKAAVRKSRQEPGLELETPRPTEEDPVGSGADDPKVSPRHDRRDALFAGDKGFLSDFVSEATEHLEDIDALLLDLERNTSSTDTLNGLFRCFHTIKGVADFLGLVDISNLAHCVESLLDRLREGSLVCRASTLDLLFEATDLLRNLVSSVANSIGGDGEIERDVTRVPAMTVRLESASRDEESCLADRPGSESSATEDSVEGREPLKTLSAYGARSDTGQSAKPREKGRFGLPPTVKVDSRRLDLLLDTIGELVVAVSVAHRAARHHAGDPGSTARTQVEKLTRTVQEVGTSLRMIPLLSTFRKMMRFARDLGKRCGKSLQFSFSGEGAELDRTIVQQIQDPLLHILRNAIDHGLESGEERVEKGKPKVACVSTRAYHKGGSFFIEVADDGRGFDPELILRKARTAGILPEGRELTREEILRLVFEPGFSTAEEVSNISGRGVGMDVVKRTVERLGGTADIESLPGKGTVITLRLPLTVAMIEGMVIRVGDQRFVVPTLAMLRVHQPKPGEIKTLSQKEEFLSSQDRLVPLIRLGRVFEIEGAESDATNGVIILVEGKGRKAGLLVDELLGQQQIVIKGLGRALQNVPGIAGGAVMPDGKVGLILDVQGIVEIVHTSREVLLKAVG